MVLRTIFQIRTCFYCVTSIESRNMKTEVMKGYTMFKYTKLDSFIHHSFISFKKKKTKKNLNESLNDEVLRRPNA